MSFLSVCSVSIYLEKAPNHTKCVKIQLFYLFGGCVCRCSKCSSTVSSWWYRWSSCGGPTLPGRCDMVLPKEPWCFNYFNCSSEFRSAVILRRILIMRIWNDIEYLLIPINFIHVIHVDPQLWHRSQENQTICCSVSPFRQPLVLLV